MKVGLVALTGCFSAGIVSVLDVLRVAERLRPGIETGTTIAPVEVELIGMRRRVIAESGVILPTTRTFDDLDDFDVVVVGALDALTTDELLEDLSTRDVRALVATLARSSGRRPVLAAACTGAFVLAEAGRLDGSRATTSWWLGPDFRARYPAVTLDLDAMVVADNGIVTAGAAFAHIDLALRLLHDHSPELAAAVAAVLIIDPRPAQSAYVAFDHIQHVDPIVIGFERYARTNLSRAFDITTAARALGTSRRTLERRTAQSLGISPIALLQRLRADKALHLLRTTDESVEQIAAHVGYANASTLRTLLRRNAPATPAALR